MSKKKREGALYQRGKYWLDWDRRKDGSLRSPYLAIFWYDQERGGFRSSSTRTADVEEGKARLDAFYLGSTSCPTCHRPFDERSGGRLVTEVIETYQTLHAGELKSANAIRSRLAHVVSYLGHSKQLGITCEAIDNRWVGGFRKWSAAQPVMSPKGKVMRERSLSSTETALAQLAAVIHHAKVVPNFKPQPIHEVNRTPQYRASVEKLAEMFRYCVQPDVREDLGKPFGRAKALLEEHELVALRRRERAALHRFLIISVATLARPDAAYDVNLDPARRQWSGNARILDLNPAGRRQTTKYRAAIPLAAQAVPWLDAALQQWQAAKAEAEKKRGPMPPPPFFVGPRSIRKAWAGMAKEVGLPTEREAGEKLIRRSMADLVRSRLPIEAVAELSMFLGHDKTDRVTSLYAPFSPDYLRRALGAIEGVIDEIETLCPGAFSRTLAGAGADVVPIRGALSA